VTESATQFARRNWIDFTNNAGTSLLPTQSIYLEVYKGMRNNITAHSQNFKIFDLAADLKEVKNLAGFSTFFNGLRQRMKDRVFQARMPDTSAPRPYDKVPVPAIMAAIIAATRSRFQPKISPVKIEAKNERAVNGKYYGI
jgi:hypothetical protein